MWSDSSGVAEGLGLAGFLLVVAAYSTYGMELWRLGYPRRPVERSAGSLLVAVAASVAWGLASLLNIVSSQRLWWHLSLGADQLRYAAWAIFLLSLQSYSAPPQRRHLLFTVLPLTLLALGVCANVALSTHGQDGGQAARFLVAVQLAWAVLGLVLVEQLFRNQGESSRWSAKPLCLGLACMFLFDVYLFAQGMLFGRFDNDAMGARALVHVVAVPMLLVASRRNAHWMTRLRVSNAAAFYSASLLLVGAYLLFVAAAGYYIKYFGGTWGGALQVALLAAALVALSVFLLSGTQRSRLRVFLGKHFYRYRYDYRVEWLRFTSVLSTRTSPREFGQLVVRGLADLVESPGGALWTRAAGDESFAQSARWNMPASGDSEPVDSPFCRFLREREWIAYLRDTSATDNATAPPWLPAIEGAWLVVPLLVSGELYGFVVLTQPRTRVDVNWEVRDLLKTAARQAAAFLAHISAAEALLEVRKFDAFNRMSAFVVHDLKNIVTQLSLMLRNAERHRDNPEFQRDMLATVENSLEKMKQMMLQLREGERPTGVAAGVDLTSLVHRIQRSSRLHGREVAVEIAERVATRGHEQRLERVIGHIVQNALDATPATGRVWVRVARRGGYAQVVVGDTGVGMTKDFIRTTMFRPFSSTKSNGMGIGTYESATYVKELSGQIQVESEPGQGAVVTIELPLFDLGAGADETVRRTVA